MMWSGLQWEMKNEETSKIVIKATTYVDKAAPDGILVTCNSYYVYYVYYVFMYEW